MKNSIVSISSFLFLIIVLFACQDVKQTSEYLQMREDRDSLWETLSERESQLEEFARQFDLIEQNLLAIDSSNQSIRNIKSVGGFGQKERIHSLIAGIYITLDQNKSAIDSLENQSRVKGNIKPLQILVSTIRASLKRREAEIKQLENELINLKLEVKNLQDAVLFREREIKEKDTLLARQSSVLETQKQLLLKKDEESNRAYYIRGTSKELENAGIIRSEGGLLGIGAVKILGEKLGDDRVRSINIKEDRILLIGRYKKKKVVSVHPSDSYFFIAKEGQYYLKISYPEKFWSLSKYLVVVVE
jgi:hypothetical protein